MFTIISNKGIKTMNKPIGVNQDNRIATIIALKRVFWGVALTLLVAALLAAIIVIGSHPVYRDYLVYGAVVLSTLLVIPLLIWVFSLYVEKVKLELDSKEGKDKA